MRKYSYNEFGNDCRILAKIIKESKENFDALLIIARGGLALGQYLSHLLGIRTCLCLTCSSYDDKDKTSAPQITNIPELKYYKNILVIDDMVDSGDSLSAVLQRLRKDYEKISFKSAVLFYKTTSCIKPEFYLNITDEWIEFPWENVDE